MAKHPTITLQVRVVWWLKWYMAGVILMCWLTGLDFDEVKVRQYVRRGLRAKVIRHP
ncbi:hypothetical protein [Halopseudomonas pertucinogena]|uniref:Transposase n=1 Tax=Halopseudomonas pertucinogena TaxID=86175 RepID=A0ABQ2CRQ9_9GAMM|nr:hypothetical protein [Halopseudomonas pertucinogena]GGJ06446.1 hypothetical protein GCM10009083_24320 [Halopseudomonas pertucinogena]